VWRRSWKRKPSSPAVARCRFPGASEGVPVPATEDVARGVWGPAPRQDAVGVRAQRHFVALAAGLRGARVPRLPYVWCPGARVRAPAVHGVRARAAGAVLVQGARLLPELREWPSQRLELTDQPLDPFARATRAVPACPPASPCSLPDFYACRSCVDTVKPVESGSSDTDRGPRFSERPHRGAEQHHVLNQKLSDTEG
jgi:hypothetical protein